MLATVNEQTMVPFVRQQLNNLELALALAKRGNLPGAEALVGQNFDRLFSMGQFKEAAEAAAESPQVGRVHMCRALESCREANCRTSQRQDITKVTASPVMLLKAAGMLWL